MANPIDLTCDEVIKFLKSKGGTTTNLELVSQFRKMLNDPLHQVEMRLRFKDIINSIANVTENNGKKCISLKEKYLNCASFQSETLSDEIALSRNAESPENQNNQSYQPYWRYRLSCSGKPSAPAPNLSLQPIASELMDYKRRCSYPQTDCSNESPVFVNQQQLTFPPLAVGTVQDKRKARVFDSLWLDPTGNHTPEETDYASQENVNILYDDSEHCDQRMLPYPNSYHKETSDIMSLFNKQRSLSSPFPHPVSSSFNSYQFDKENDYDKNLHNHKENLTVNDQEQARSCDSVISSNEEIHEKRKDVCKERTNLLPEVSGSTQDQSVTLKDDPDEEYRAHSTSVKERAQQIERMSALEAVPARKSSPHSNHKYSKYRDFGSRNRMEKISDDDTSVVSTLDSKLRRQWFVNAAKSDYHGLLGLLKVEPRLAGLRDFTSGFTALHWAAKNGNAEVVKLIAGSHRVSPDIKSHGGYTCIHLAALYKHKPLIELLVKTYGADPTVRDNSGKRADQYPSDYLSFAGSNRTTICNRHYKSITIPVNHKLIRVRQPEPQSGTFIRIGSLNLKVSMTAPNFGSSKGRRIQRLKTWGSADSVAESWSSSGPSDRMSFRRKKKAKKKNVELQHRGSISSKQDSDSDGAYGFHS